ncbi:MAG: hypothetical protein ACI4SH_08010 [Candidatus Scatosoma sp.]
MFYTKNGADTGYGNAKTNAQGAALWECALNYKIMRQLKEGSEEEAWARLFSCSLFSSSEAGKNAKRAAAGV